MLFVDQEWSESEEKTAQNFDKMETIQVQLWNCKYMYIMYINTCSTVLIYII